MRAKARALVHDPFLLTTFIAIWGLLLFFILFPLGTLIWKVFVGGTGFTLKHFVGSFLNWENRRALYNTLLLATLTASSGTALGFLFAFTITRTRGFKIAKKVLGYIPIIPLVSPPFLAAFALLVALGGNGIITRYILGLQHVNIYGLFATWLSETLTYFPTAMLVFMGVLSSVNPNLEGAGLLLGDSRLGVFRRITLPLAVPGIANAFLLVFAESMADFATPLILAGSRFPLLPTRAYMEITGMFNLPGGAALAFLMIIPAIIVFILQKYWVAKRNRVIISGKPTRVSAAQLVGSGTGVALWGACVLVSLFIFFIYSLLIYISFVNVWGANNALTIKHYIEVFTMGATALKDTSMLAWIAAPAGSLLALLVAYIIRQRIPAKGLLEFVSMLNYALPGIAVGIAYLIAFNRPFGLVGTMPLVFAVLIFRYNPVGIRSAIASLEQIGPSIEEASATLGATLITTFRKVMVPMLIPAFFAGLEYLYIRSFTAISAVIFLASARTQLMTVRILENLTELALGRAAAFSVVMVVFVLVGTAIFRAILHLMEGQQRV